MAERKTGRSGDRFQTKNTTHIQDDQKACHRTLKKKKKLTPRVK